MKRLIACLLAAVMCLALAACGVSEEVRSAEDMIAAIGEVTLESEEAIAAAESAYDALPDADKNKVSNYADLTAAREAFDAALNDAAAAADVEQLISAIGEVTLESEEAIVTAEKAYDALSEGGKAYVVSYADLTAARETLDAAKAKQALLAAIPGDWVSVSGTDRFTLAEDGTAFWGELVYFWRVDEDVKTVSIDGLYSFALDPDAEFVSLTVDADNRKASFIRQEDYEAFGEKYLTVVELTDENAAEYFGAPEYLADETDEEGNALASLYHLPSAAYENGLVYIGCGEDFAVQIVDENDTPAGNPYRNPFGPFRGGEGAVAHVEGTLCFIAAEQVSDVSYTPDGAYRVVTTADGYVFEDRCAVYGLVPYYQYMADGEIVF